MDVRKLQKPWLETVDHVTQNSAVCYLHALLLLLEHLLDTIVYRFGSSNISFMKFLQCFVKLSMFLLKMVLYPNPGSMLLLRLFLSVHMLARLVILDQYLLLLYYVDLLKNLLLKLT